MYLVKISLNKIQPSQIPQEDPDVYNVVSCVPKLDITILISVV